MKEIKQRFLDGVMEMNPEMSGIVHEIRKDEADGKLLDVPRSHLKCQSWLDAWVYCFWLAHLDTEHHLWIENHVLCGAIWVGVDFDDRIVGVLEKVGKRIGSDVSFREIRLVRTGVTAQGIERLQCLFPNARILEYSEEVHDADPSISWWPEPK